eukprot:5649517-Pleurochrysis_carterae.AAC.2
MLGRCTCTSRCCACSCSVRSARSGHARAFSPRAAAARTLATASFVSTASSTRRWGAASTCDAESNQAQAAGARPSFPVLETIGNCAWQRVAGLHKRDKYRIDSSYSCLASCRCTQSKSGHNGLNPRRIIDQENMCVRFSCRELVATLRRV